MEFQPGETYGGYEFLDIVKRSRNWIEFRVRNTQVGRLEALRALPQSAQDDPAQVDRFLREMRVHACLLHPNIVTLFSVIELEGHLVMTTELVEGSTLADRLTLGPIPHTEAVPMVRQLVAALTYAHQQRIVHRDIRPDNIILTTTGLVKLANFGLAKSASSPKLTQVGMVLGHVSYISPEQIKGTGEMDQRSDLYSLGMVLFEMLCGRPAFNCESQFELMAAQVNQAPTPPHVLNPAIPESLSAAVLKSLAKNPAARYQTAEEFDHALAHAEVAQTPAAPDPMSSPEAMPDFLVSASSSVSSQRLIIGGAAGACLGALLMVLWLFIK